MKTYETARELSMSELEQVGGGYVIGRTAPVPSCTTGGGPGWVNDAGVCTPGSRPLIIWANPTDNPYGP